MRPLKTVCLITNAYPDFEGSPRGVFVKQMVDLMKGNGYRFSVVTPRIFDRSRRLETNGSETIYRFDFLSENRLLVDYGRIPILRMMTYMVAGVSKGLQIVKRDRCDLIHAHFTVPAGLIGVIVARLLGRKVILTAYGTDISWRGSKVVEACSRFVLRHSDYLVVISEYTREKVQRFVKSGIPIEMIYAAGVDTRKFNPNKNGSEARRELGLHDTDFVLLFVGNLVERKQVGDLISATARLKHLHPHVKLIVGGDGELRQTLENQAIREHGDSTVTFLGRVPDDLLPSLYALANVFVLPSREEGLGVVLLEAMASGTTVVASRTTGILSVIEEGRTGLLYEPGNIEGLVAKIQQLIENSDLGSKLGEAARGEAVERFAREKQAQKLLRVYDRCLSP